MPRRPQQSRTPSKSSSDATWVDLSVLSEVARRLRNAGTWDNTLADGIALLKLRIETLERFSKFEGFDYRAIKRPLQSWEDCRRLLTVITSSRLRTFSDIPAPIEACLNLAIALHKWEQIDSPIPRDIRGMMYGGICVEWSDSQYEIFDGKLECQEDQVK